MDGWMDGWMDGYTDRQTDRQILREVPKLEAEALMYSFKTSTGDGNKCPF